MGKWSRRYRQPVRCYSAEHHLSRAVQCVDCGAVLHKDHHYVLHGHRCAACWSRPAPLQSEQRPLQS